MNQKQIDKLRETIKSYGIPKTISLFGGDKDIIRKAYINNPESYLDYLIDNLYEKYNPTKDTISFITKDTNNVIFECDRHCYHFNLKGEIMVDMYIWHNIYIDIMNFTDDEIQNVFKRWLNKHIRNLSELTPVCKYNYVSFSGGTFFNGLNMNYDLNMDLIN